MPSVGIHADLKLANVALFPDDTVAFIDWQMAMRAPVAVELGWFLVANSGSLPMPPAPVMDGYLEAAAAAATDVGRGGVAAIGDPEALRDLTWILGLTLRGWRKGLDAADGVTLPSGMTALDDLRWWATAATAAADRRL